VAGLVADREAARRAGDYARADALRDRLAAVGWRVADGAGGPEVRPIGEARDA
jgi:cysteinyl-tRNA synthetase